MNIIILHNPKSGTSKKTSFLAKILKQCIEEGWKCEIRSSWWINKEENVDKILQKKSPIILIQGGDGTIRHIIQAFWTKKALKKIRFFILGGGTFNALSKNCLYSKKEKNIVQILKRNKIKALDLLEMHLEKDGNIDIKVVQTGALFVKDSGFVLHITEIRKAFKRFDLRHGFKSLKKTIPYLENIPCFSYKENGILHIAQGIYVANNPYLITNKPIHSSVSIEDGRLNVFTAKNLNYFEIGQVGSVLLLSKKRDLPFLGEEVRKEWSSIILENIDLNIDGDIMSVEKGTNVRVKISEQKASIYC